MESTQASTPEVEQLLKVAAGNASLRGTFFVNDAREMLRATREIEEAAAERGATLYVGFQDAARLDDEAQVYERLSESADITAYGVGEPTVDIPQLTWINVPRDRRALHNQWFLVLRGEEDLAFVGYETSPPKYFRKGPSYNEGRTWDGFTTDDDRVVGHLLEQLDHIRALTARTPTRWYLAATDDGADPRYTAVREAAVTAARDEDVGLVLYDRTTESYLTNPYPSGPWSGTEDALSPTWELTPGRLDAIGRGYLAQQLRDAGEADVVAVAHMALDRGAKALRQAVDQHLPEAVFLPAHLAEPSLLDRVRGNTLAALTGAVDVPVRLVDADGTVTDMR